MAVIKASVSKKIEPKVACSASMLWGGTRSCNISLMFVYAPLRPSILQNLPVKYNKEYERFS